MVPGSEQVMVDGQRMTRGEAADYAIDYERARITFSNKRPISSASRITVEFHDPVRNPAQARLRGVQFAGTAVMQSEGRALQVHGGTETDIVNGIADGIRGAAKALRDAFSVTIGDAVNLLNPGVSDALGNVE